MPCAFGVVLPRVPVNTNVSSSCVRCHASSRETGKHKMDWGRSDVVRYLTTGAVMGSLISPEKAHSSLVLMPTNELNNTYFLVRAGQSEAERDGYVDTNPVSKTSMSNGLSEEGKLQVLRQTYPMLRELGAGDGAPWFWPSTSQGAYQTAEILGYLFQIGRERIVPEYSFLDARGLGIFDGLPPQEAAEKIHALDAVSNVTRPPGTYTGTPNESVDDVFARVRQLLSVTETQYYGSNVVFISPDSDNLTVLQAAVMGLKLTEHATLAFAPGEARSLQLAKEKYVPKSMSFECKNPPSCR